MQWMAWTVPTAVFCIAIAVMLVIMSTLQAIRPTAARKGWLPMVTTRGDRLFMGLLGSAYIQLAWLAFTEGLSLWWSVGIAAVWLAALLRWG